MGSFNKVVGAALPMSLFAGRQQRAIAESPLFLAESKMDPFSLERKMDRKLISQNRIMIPFQ